MVENIRPNEGETPESERRKTAILREGPPRREVLAALEEDKRTAREKIEGTVASGTLLEGLAGTCAAVLALIALIGTFPVTLTAVGIIVLGGSVLISAGGLGAVLAQVRTRVRLGQLLAGGAGLDAVAGAAAVAGGILVLAKVVPLTLLPVSIIVLGGAYLVESGGFQFFVAGPAGTAEPREAVASGASATEILVGLGAITLAVLALSGIQAALLTEIAVLAMGVGILAKCMTFSACAASRGAGA